MLLPPLLYLLWPCLLLLRLLLLLLLLLPRGSESLSERRWYNSHIKGLV